MKILSSFTILIITILAVIVVGSMMRISASSSPSSVSYDESNCPPSGWDSYDSQPIWAGYIPSEASALQQASALYPFAKVSNNWKTIVLDEGWADVRLANQSYVWYLNKNGIPVPIPQNFPSSKNGEGLKPLAQELSTKYNMSLGVWHVKGIPRAAVEQKLPIAGTNYTCDQIITPTKKVCSWHKDVYDVDVSHPGGQAYYDSVIDLWVSWGITYFKIDCIFGSDLRATEIEAYSASIQKARRKYNVDITFSISPGFLANRTTVAPLYNTSVNLFRVTDDLWDCFGPSLLPTPQCMLSNVAATVWTLEYFQAFLDKPNAFGQKQRPDPDMIPVSKIRIWWTHQSRFTGKMLNFIFGMWAITKSPLILGGDLTAISNATQELPELTKLLSNPDLRQMHCVGANPTVVYSKNVTKTPTEGIEGEIMWRLEVASNPKFSSYVGYFPFDPWVGDHNVNKNATSRKVLWSELGLVSSSFGNNNNNKNKPLGQITTAPIPSITAYDVLNRKILKTYNPATEDGFVMTSYVNDAAVWQFFMHE